MLQSKFQPYAYHKKDHSCKIVWKMDSVVLSNSDSSASSWSSWPMKSWTVLQFRQVSLRFCCQRDSGSWAEMGCVFSAEEWQEELECFVKVLLSAASGSSRATGFEECRLGAVWMQTEVEVQPGPLLKRIWTSSLLERPGQVARKLWTKMWTMLMFSWECMIFNWC